METDHDFNLETKPEAIYPDLKSELPRININFDTHNTYEEQSGQTKDNLDDLADE